VLAFARIRKIDSDFNRTERQRYVLRTALEKALTTKDMGGIITMVNYGLEHVETNIPLEEIISLGYEVLTRGMPKVDEFRVPMDGSYNYARYFGASVLTIDFPKNIRGLHEFIYGTSQGVKINNFPPPSYMGPDTGDEDGEITGAPVTDSSAEPATDPRTGEPEPTERLTDPETGRRVTTETSPGVPVTRPETGEPVIDPISGKIMTEPRTTT
jgi:hypothetical protein